MCKTTPSCGDLHGLHVLHKGEGSVFSYCRTGVCIFYGCATRARRATRSYIGCELASSFLSPRENARHVTAGFWLFIAPTQFACRFHCGKQRVCFISIANDPRPVNVARPNSLRTAFEQGKHFIPNFTPCVLLCWLREFRVAARQTNLRVRLLVSPCRVQACARVRPRRANPREGKRQCATPVRSNVPRR